MADTRWISVVDDDDSVRESLGGLLKSIGFAVAVFRSAEEFLETDSLSGTDCLILDIRMPGMSGPALQRELAVRRRAIPIIFITAYDDEDLRSRASGCGVVDCLVKPFSEETLLSAINKALGQS